MQERDISRADVKNCIMHGEIIEDYPDDFPHPSCLIFGYTVIKKSDPYGGKFGCWKRFHWNYNGIFPQHR